MALTKQQKALRRKQERLAAEAGDPRAKAKRAAEAARKAAGSPAERAQKARLGQLHADTSAKRRAGANRRAAEALEQERDPADTAYEPSRAAPADQTAEEAAANEAAAAARADHEAAVTEAAAAVREALARAWRGSPAARRAEGFRAMADRECDPSRRAALYRKALRCLGVREPAVGRAPAPSDARERPRPAAPGPPVPQKRKRG